MITEQGTVEDGGIVLSRSLALPDGIEVIVRIEPLTGEREAEAAADREELADLSFSRGEAAWT